MNRKLTTELDEEDIREAIKNYVAYKTGTKAKISSKDVQLGFEAPRFSAFVTYTEDKPQYPHHSEVVFMLDKGCAELCDWARKTERKYYCYKGCIYDLTDQYICDELQVLGRQSG